VGIRGRLLAAAFACVSLTAPMPLAFGVNATQSVGTQTPKQEVPNNMVEHAPPVQPIPYSHKKHLALGLECQLCHTNPEPGNLMTFPATSTCMSCHTTIAESKPAIRKLASFAKSQQPVPWVRVYAVLPGVRWTHRKHLAAGMKCEICHGQVAEMEAMSEATSVTTMGACLSCHKTHNAPVACQTCHVWPTSPS
jgi:hypothetical protein